MDNQDNGAAFEPTPLEDVFSRRPSAEAKPEPAGQQAPPSPEPSAPETGDQTARPLPPRDDVGRFTAPQAEAGPPPAEAPEPEAVPVAALRSEREKRQAAERQAAEHARMIADLQAKLAAVQSPPPSKPDIAKEMWQDPEGPEAYAAKLAERQRQEVEAQIVQTRFTLSESYARRQYADFDQVAEVFGKAVEAQARGLGVAPQETPLAAGLRKHPDPAQFAYEMGKKAMTFARIGDDPEAFIASEVQKRVQAALAAAQSPEASPSLPASLASVRSTGGRTPAGFAGPTPLEAIIGPRAPRRK